jgi:hypothetical protein
VVRRTLFCLCLIALSGDAAAAPAGPPAGFEHVPDTDNVSPDKSTRVEHYANANSDQTYGWQLWARHGSTFTLLAPEQAYYNADFRFTPDSNWLVRMQKTSSGEASVYLYRLGTSGFVTATPKPLSDLAWSFFLTQPDAKGLGKLDYHVSTGLIKGTEENYRWMGVHWPDSRYLVLTLSAVMTARGHDGRQRYVEGWHCRYDLQTGTFDVPKEAPKYFSRNNAKALAPD